MANPLYHCNDELALVSLAVSAVAMTVDIKKNSAIMPIPIYKDVAIFFFFGLCFVCVFLVRMRVTLFGMLFFYILFIFLSILSLVLFYFIFIFLKDAVIYICCFFFS